MENEVLDCLKTRRSVRSYRAEQITDEQLDAILEAGTYAATGMGRQSPKIVVLQKPEDIAYLQRLNAGVMGDPNGKPFYGAPTVLIVFADSRIMTSTEDGSLVIGNLMNAAHAVGVDSCWIHRAREEFETPEGKALMEKWGIDPCYKGVGHCILGYAATEPAAPRPRKCDYILKI